MILMSMKSVKGFQVDNNFLGCSSDMQSVRQKSQLGYNVLLDTVWVLCYLLDSNCLQDMQ